MITFAGCTQANIHPAIAGPNMTVLPAHPIVGPPQAAFAEESWTQWIRDSAQSGNSGDGSTKLAVAAQPIVSDSIGAVIVSDPELPDDPDNTTAGAAGPFLISLRDSQTGRDLELDLMGSQYPVRARIGEQWVPLSSPMQQAPAPGTALQSVDQDLQQRVDYLREILSSSLAAAAVPYSTAVYSSSAPGYQAQAPYLQYGQPTTSPTFTVPVPFFNTIPVQAPPALVQNNLMALPALGPHLGNPLLLQYLQGQSLLAQQGVAQGMQAVRPPITVPSYVPAHVPGTIVGLGQGQQGMPFLGQGYHVGTTAQPMHHTFRPTPTHQLGTPPTQASPLPDFMVAPTPSNLPVSFPLEVAISTFEPIFEGGDPYLQPPGSSWDFSYPSPSATTGSLSSPREPSPVHLVSPDPADGIHPLFAYDLSDHLTETSAHLTSSEGASSRASSRRGGGGGKVLPGAARHHLTAVAALIKESSPHHSASTGTTSSLTSSTLSSLSSFELQPLHCPHRTCNHVFYCEPQGVLRDPDSATLVYATSPDVLIADKDCPLVTHVIEDHEADIVFDDPHLKTKTGRPEKVWHCPYVGCNYKSKKSNVAAHMLSGRTGHHSKKHFFCQPCLEIHKVHTFLYNYQSVVQHFEDVHNQRVTKRSGGRVSNASKREDTIKRTSAPPAGSVMDGANGAEVGDIDSREKGPEGGGAVRKGGPGIQQLVFDSAHPFQLARQIGHPYAPPASKGVKSGGPKTRMRGEEAYEPELASDGEEVAEEEDRGEEEETKIEDHGDQHDNGKGKASTAASLSVQDKVDKEDRSPPKLDSSVDELASRIEGLSVSSEAKVEE
ncbi:hypothetical protein M427DRAFT_149399 [Gonapodya prolifera JEL478]|uniref:Uncharacterized protein n=1 Tax=Gonapodya prolifera (strain JEL478) TaxID=1344416 RepID=A0A138ZZM0_GONPJ|nr:hypothetical protein M427DRAFT_149399 [Gonapodya prolifera JEL478]|eukprot:KXS09858.1 hypothetical protein M427DRAFT_149399 [Gonapodya prolifera JEL478]